MKINQFAIAPTTLADEKKDYCKFSSSVKLIYNSHLTGYYVVYSNKVSRGHQS